MYRDMASVSMALLPVYIYVHTAPGERDMVIMRHDVGVFYQCIFMSIQGRGRGIWW